jgi:hypothetical protein
MLIGKTGFAPELLQKRKLRNYTTARFLTLYQKISPLSATQIQRSRQPETGWLLCSIYP